MATVVAAQTVLTGSEALSPGAVTVDDGTVVSVDPTVPAGVEVRRGYLVPGFVDIHSHGGGGATVVGGDPEAVETFARTHLAHGTTTIVASLVSAHPEPLMNDVRALADLTEDGVIAGSHLEGPWISPAMKGAHDPTALRAPAPAEVEAIIEAGRGTIAMVTLAPELDHGFDAVRRFAESGTIAAVGHSDADWAQAKMSLDAGATVTTHLFNQMRGVHHRQPGPIPALMADPRMHVELIVDGIHVHPAVVAMVRQAVPADRILFVTDAMAATGQADGDYMLGELAVRVIDGVARLVEGGALAGSTLTMDAAFRRAVTECGFAPSDAVLAASVTPARMLGRADIGTLRVGARADMVWLGDDFALQQVWQRGRAVAS
jgi:N-acetylglucosamine-6-phosphate deacetylase